MRTRLRGFTLLLGIVRASQSYADSSSDLSISLDIRERATYLSAIEWDTGNDDAGWFWTQRVALNGIYQGKNVDGKLALVSAVSKGIAITPIEENRLDVQEAYIDLKISGGTLRVGRQELKLGSQRLVGWRDGTNVRRTWEGLRYKQEAERSLVDFFHLREVDVAPTGAFNDTSSNDRNLTGLYVTTNTDLTSADFYYLHSQRSDRTTIEGVANERRSTIGSRVFGEFKSWYWNWEAAYQFGEHGYLDIDAWTLATNTGFHLDHPWSVEFMLSANVSSGDGTRGDGKLQTFDALYPRGSYFSEIAQLGPSNFYNLNPYIRLQPTQDVNVSVDINWFWRNEKNDGVYGPPGNIIRKPNGSPHGQVSTALSSAIEWQVTDKLFMSLVMTYSQPGRFIRDTGPADNAVFTEFTLGYSFP